MHFLYGIALGLSGFIAGAVAGAPGISGGVLLVPLMVSAGIAPLQSVATTTFAKCMIAASGSWHNWCRGSLSYQRVLRLGLPAVVTAQLGVYFIQQVSASILLSAFGGLLLVNLYLIQLRWQLTHQDKLKGQQQYWLVPIWSAICGSTAGVLTGLFGVGSGILLVPLQILLLGETVDIAICTSLGVVLLTSLSACTSHLLGGSIVFPEGLILGITGSFGAQIGMRLLPKLPGMMVVLSAQVILVVLGICILWLIWTRSPTRVFSPTTLNSFSLIPKLNYKPSKL